MKFIFALGVPLCFYSSPSTFLCSFICVCEAVACRETVGECDLIRQSILIVFSNKDKREAPHVCTRKTHTYA